MSNIPSTAIAGALIPVERSMNDALRARRVQTAKNHHHSDEVDELDETAVNSVREEKQQRDKKDEPDGEEKESEEKVEIQALTSEGLRRKNENPTAAGSSRLDISA